MRHMQSEILEQYEIVEGLTIKAFLEMLKSNPEVLEKWGLVRKVGKASNSGPPAGACPECGWDLIREGGCVRCSNPSCGYSECG